MRRACIPSSPAPLALNNLFESLFGPEVAYAHGIPWDPWLLMNADGSGLHRVAEVGGDESSVAWSPDESQLFVYSGTGSYIVDGGVVAGGRWLGLELSDRLPSPAVLAAWPIAERWLAMLS